MLATNNISPSDKDTLKNEIKKRVTSFQALLVQEGIEGALIMQAADLVYFCGVFQNCFLYIPAEGDPLLMVRRSMERVISTTPLDHVIPLKSINQVPSIIADYGYKPVGRLGIEADVIPALLYFKLQKLFAQSKLVDCSRAIKTIRAVKSEFELNLFKETGKMMDKVFASIPDFICVGSTEIELAGQLEARLRKEGHQGLVRMRGFNPDFHYGCFLSGPSGGVPSYFDGPVGGPGMDPAFPFGVSRRIVQKNEPIYIDYAGVLHGYIIDMTRLYVLGELDQKLLKAHQVALEIQQTVAETAKPGALGNEIYDMAYNIACKYKLQDNFMGCGDQVSFIAHGVGLELNELPVIARGFKMPLQEGMVIALEPKFVFPNEGAVGIENTFVVTPQGLDGFNDYPDDLVMIECE